MGVLYSFPCAYCVCMCVCGYEGRGGGHHIIEEGLHGSAGCLTEGGCMAMQGVCGYEGSVVKCLYSCVVV